MCHNNNGDIITLQVQDWMKAMSSVVSPMLPQQQQQQQQAAQPPPYQPHLQHPTYSQ